MKKLIKPLVAFALALVICVAMLVPAFSAEGKPIASVADAYNLVCGIEEGSDEKTNDFVNIYKGKCEGKDAYIIACRGLNVYGISPTDPRGYVTVVKAILSNENNQYVKKLVKAIKENCTEYKNLVFIGHSLGGMICQQVIAQREIKKNYNVLYTLAIGDPYILTSSLKEGYLERVIDTVDPVPYLSLLGLANPYIGNKIEGHVEGVGVIDSHFAYNDLYWNGFRLKANISVGDCVCDVPYWYINK